MLLDLLARDPPVMVVRRQETRRLGFGCKKETVKWEGMMVGRKVVEAKLVQDPYRWMGSVDFAETRASC